MRSDTFYLIGIAYLFLSGFEQSHLFSLIDIIAAFAFMIVALFQMNIDQKQARILREIDRIQFKAIYEKLDSIERSLKSRRSR